MSELCCVAAEALSKKEDKIESLRKIAEGGSYRVFEITFKDGDQAIARLPYPSTRPVTLGVSSEVVTMEYLRLHHFLVPKVHAWNSSPTNPVGAEYMIMERVPGIELEHLWYSMDLEKRMSVVEQLVNLERRLFELQLPANGSIYYSSELGSDFESMDITSSLTDKRFCVGPSTEYLWWYQSRAALTKGRGPCKTLLQSYLLCNRLTFPGASSRDVLEEAGRRESAWLKSNGKPSIPREPFYRELYGHQEVDPNQHLRSLSEYLSIACYLIPDDGEMTRPTLRHPDLSPNNLFISEIGQITGIIDWQHCVALPLFLQANIPCYFQNWGDESSETFQPPKLPEDFSRLSSTDQETEMDIYRRRQLHYFYLGFTNKKNP